MVLNFRNYLLVFKAKRFQKTQIAFTIFFCLFLQKIQIIETIPSFQRKTSNYFVWFHTKLLKLRESGTNRTSQFRSKVKRDSVKCWKLLSSVNFPWTWIHWPITSVKDQTRPHLVFFLMFPHWEASWVIFVTPAAFAFILVVPHYPPIGT